MSNRVLTLCLVLAAALAGCQGTDNDLVEVTLAPASVTLAPGESQTLQATVRCSYDPCQAALALVQPTLPPGVQVSGLELAPQPAGKGWSWSLTLAASADAPVFTGGLEFAARPTDGQSFESRQIEVKGFSLSLRVTGQVGSAPVARFGYSPADPGVGQPISFDATASTGSIASYRWDFGNDGSVEATGPTATYSFGVAGAWPVRLQLVGADGSVAETVRTLEVADAAGGDALLTLSFTGEGRGTVSFTPTATACSRDSEPVCQRPFPSGSSVVLRAFAYEGSRLGAWAPGCSTVSVDGVECTVFMDGHRQISLRFD